MNIISLGSNCEMSMMTQGYIRDIIPNSLIYTHLFAWANIKINGINYFLKNPSQLNFSNFRTIYRLYAKNGNNISKNGTGYYDFNELLEDMKTIQNIESIHIDVDYTFEDTFFWTHGIQLSINQFNESNNSDYLNDVKNKTTHIIEKTLSILNNNDVKLFCIKCLKGEYSFEDIIELNSLLLNYSSNNYVSIIVEKDENINLDNLNLTNTSIISASKLTGHHEAIYSDRYNTGIYYKQLFENAKKMLNI
jgi:hypothetical protein